MQTTRNTLLKGSYLSRMRFFKCLPYELKAFTDLSVYEQEKLRVLAYRSVGSPSPASPDLYDKSVPPEKKRRSPLFLAWPAYQKRISALMLLYHSDKIRARIREAALVASGKAQYDERGFLCTALYRE